MDRGRSDYFNFRTFHDLWRSDESGMTRDDGSTVLSSPANLEIHDPHLVPLCRKPLEKVVALVRAPLDPIRFLKDEDTHGIRTSNARGGIQYEG
jgi:hypothetical protein